MKEVVGIQYLRGLAALSVVIFHALGALRPIDGVEPVWRYAWAGGVDVFFVISGFIIWLSAGRSTQRPGQWWLNRLIRIAPLYWLTLLATLAIMALRANGGSGDLPDLGEIVASFLFIFHVNSQSGEFTPILVPGWSLNHEFVFYLMVAISLFLNKPAARFVLLATMILALVGLRSVADPTSPLQNRGTSPMQLEFLAGIVIAILYPWLRALPWRHVLGVIAVLAAAAALIVLAPRLYADGAGPRTIYFGGPATMLLFGVVCLEDKLSAHPLALLRTLGDASYSLYLSHPLVGAIPTMIWKALGGESFWLGMVLILGVTVGYAILQYRFIEAPMLRVLRNWTAGRTRPATGRMMETG
ncbi:MAG: acyltransferase [Burkholderiaceae bacterium]